MLAWTAVAVGAFGVLRAIIGLTLPNWALIHIDAVTPIALGLGSALLVAGFWIIAGTRPPDTPQPFASALWGSLIVAAVAILAALFWITDILRPSGVWTRLATPARGCGRAKTASFST